MEQFVCVRVTEISRLHHGLFQFDKNLSFAILIANADLDIYGRYGTRAGGGFIAANRPEPDTLFLATKDLSVKGFRKSMERALEFHETWKKDKVRTSQTLAAKRGRFYLDRPLRKPTTPIRVSRARGCVHCHQVVEQEVQHYWNKGRAVPDQILWSYPMPERLGFACDPAECATVESVTPRGEADRAGLRIGDQILRLAGQPILSIADIQWALHEAPDIGTISFEVDRNGEEKVISLTLPQGWRRRDGFAWRYAYNELKWKVLGLDQMKDIEEDQREKLGIGNRESAIRIGQVIRDKSPWFRTYCNLAAWKVGVRGGDIILDIDGQGRLDESGFMAYVLQETKPGDIINLTILRNGVRKKFTYRLNTLK